LTNAVRPDDVVSRLLLTLAMIGFFVIALDLPYAFQSQGWAFAVAYLLVVVIHTGLYLTSAEPTNRRAILRIAPTNAAPAVLVGVAPFLPEAWTWTLWVVSIVLVYTTNARGTARGMAIQPDHFVERHGVIVLIVLGESIVAIGIGAAGAPVDLPLAAGAALGIALSAAIWWVYFNGDEERATAALADAPPQRRQDRAFNAYAIGHVIMTMGIVVVAAGIADAIHHLGGHAQPWLLGGGAATFLAGHAVHRGVLASGRIVDRVIGAVAAVPAGLLAVIAGWAGLAAVTVVLAVVGTLDHLAMRAHQ
jgi:low temperature requirement protein LtrA